VSENAPEVSSLWLWSGWIDYIVVQHFSRSVTVFFLCFTTNSVLVLFLVLCEVSVHVFVHVWIVMGLPWEHFQISIFCMVIARSFPLLPLISLCAPGTEWGMPTNIITLAVHSTNHFTDNTDDTDNRRHLLKLTSISKLLTVLWHSWCWQRWHTQSVFQSQPNLGREERRLPLDVSCLLAGEWVYEFVHEVYLRACAGYIVLTCTCKLLQVCEWTCNQVQCVSVTWCLSHIWNCLRVDIVGMVLCSSVLC